jgi:hypothetical protein
MEFWIKSIPQAEQRETFWCGDYWFPCEGLTNIRVSETGNEDYSFLIALHEMVESWLIKKKGIPERDIHLFDKRFDESGKAGEPGDDPDSPYYWEHQSATRIEKLMCDYLKLDWEAYDKAIDALFEKED